MNIFFKNTQISNFIEFHPVGAEVPRGQRAGRQTDMTKLTVAFANMSKNVHHSRELQHKLYRH